MFPVIQTLSGKCYTTLFPMAVLSLISYDELVAAFPGSLRMKHMVPQREQSLFLKGVRPYSVILLDLPAGESSRL